jgi:hypothetical protein
MLSLANTFHLTGVDHKQFISVHTQSGKVDDSGDIFIWYPECIPGFHLCEDFYHAGGIPRKTLELGYNTTRGLVQRDSREPSQPDIQYS